MWKRIIIIILILIILSLLLSFLYPRIVAKSVELKYYPPSAVQDSLKYGKVVFSLEYPIMESHFLKNITFSPNIEGNFYFEGGVSYLFGMKGYKKIIFTPKDLERDKSYKINVFEKEFVFSLPSPQPRRVLFNKKEKKLEITFFEPIEEDYFLKEFKLRPEPEGKYIFSESNKKVIFIPKLKGKDQEYKGDILGKKIYFKIESPKVKDIYFDEEKEQVFATTTEPVTKEQVSQSFKITPSVEKSFSLDKEKTKITVKFKNLKKDQNYNLKILNKKFDFILSSVRVSNIYFDKNRQQVVVVFTRAVDESKFLESFKVTPSLNGKFTFSSKKDWVVFKPNKIEINKLYTVTVFGSRLSFRLYAIPSIKSGAKYIEIDLSSQLLKIYQKGNLLDTYSISSGKPSMPTPTGTFKVISKNRLLWSAKYSLYMPYSLQFYNDYFIHELPYWPGGYREGENHLGIPVSHGCVRLGIGPAKTVYNFADIGTKIIIHQ